MWLLDANMDVHLYTLLSGLGVSCGSAAFRGWKALENGALVAEAVSAGFDCLLTRDGLFGESAARALSQFPSFAVVVVTLPQQPWPRYRASFVRHWDDAAITPVPGHIVYWPRIRAAR